MVTFLDHPYAAVRREHKLPVAYERFTRAFESLLGVTDLDALKDLERLSPEKAREMLASFVGPLEFSLFQKVDHGTLSTVLTGRRMRATTFVFGNALIAVEMRRTMSNNDVNVRIRQEHLTKLQEIAKAKGTDVADAFGHAVDLAHAAHVGSAQRDDAGEHAVAEHAAEHADLRAKSHALIEQLGEESPAAKKAAFARLGPEDASASSSSSSISVSKKKAPDVSPLKRWAETTKAKR